MVGVAEETARTAPSVGLVGLGRRRWASVARLDEELPDCRFLAFTEASAAVQMRTSSDQLLAWRR